jgi:hypothetical protein
MLHRDILPHWGWLLAHSRLLVDSCDIPRTPCMDCACDRTRDMLENRYYELAIRMYGHVYGKPTCCRALESQTYLSITISQLCPTSCNSTGRCSYLQQRAIPTTITCQHSESEDRHFLRRPLSASRPLLLSSSRINRSD